MTEIYDNIRGIYRFSQPCRELADYIEFFSESSLEKTKQLVPYRNFSVTMFQSWTPTFWINLGTSYYIEQDRRRILVKNADDILLLRNSQVTRYVTGDDHILTVKFFPGGLEAVLGFNQASLANKVIPLSEVIPSSLIFQVKNTAGYDQRIKLLEEYLLTRVARVKNKDHYIHFIKETSDNYQTADFHPNTSQIAEKMFVSSRTINRYFNQVVGLSPKKYFSIMRARASLTEFIANKKNFNPGQFGYYDMSHFYRGIALFTQQEC